MTPDDKQKIEVGCKRWVAVRDTYGLVVHDLIADHMAEWLIDHGYDNSLEAMAHVAGNVSEADWQRVIDKVLSDLHVVEPGARN